ncbi:ABC transporter ATP-binding protein/permease [Glycomyces sp. TRM65418]|uniref:ABC transporter transmembrane domain-containing protein n=1 Tax=Glycomyces sp. TRM65418 TaxID=2867006 RepID=UPI001CE567CD|nr:ABC transporter ATP-binding protein [Glycomyces sp. TRM65418]MCC3765269.1 ABC transporter ATP-binding protein/permease [Glycomyces sp. TRM65418]QZD54890.1 ABC transporter ATP-binding protein/permease [Glycomyces sp. TRM65418]
MPSRPRPLRPKRPITPLRLLVGLARPHKGRIALGALFYLLAGSASMAQLWMIGRIVDEGFIARDGSGLVFWLSLTALAVIAQPVFWSLGFRQFVGAEAAGQRAIVRRLTDHLNAAGTGVRGRVPAGELVNLPSEDTRRAARSIADVGFFFNNFAMFTVGSALVWSIHPLLGVVIIAGSAVTSVVTGPLLGRLQRRQSDYREMIGDLTAHAADIVGGLRVLRGIGGDVLFAERYRERSSALRDKGYRVANSSSWIHAMRHSMPIVFVAAITWTGAILAADGAITIGGLASAFSFATVFIAVSGNFIGLAHFLVAAWVAAGRIAGFLHVGPDVDDSGTVRGGGGELRDPESGLTVPVGGLTAVVTAETAPALEACERLARYRDSEAVWGARPLEAYALAEVRERIMLLTDEDYLFAGTLAETLRADRNRALAAIETACAADVYSGLGGSLDGRVAEGGQNLSGGQRQRLRLARAIAAEPEILLAVEPTSAVDAHTESLVARRVAAARAGKSTVVVAASPMWLARADRVVWMVEGKVHAVGSHAELLDDPAYRRLASHRAD